MVFTVLPTRITPVDDAEWVALPIAGATITLHRDPDVPDAHLEVVRGDATVTVELAPPSGYELLGLAPAAVDAVRRAAAPCATVLHRGAPELAREVAVALGRLMRGAVVDVGGLLGRRDRPWPPDEAWARPLRAPPAPVRGHERVTVAVVPTAPQDGLACWGDLTLQLPADLDVVPGPGDTLVGPDDVLLGIAVVRRDHVAVRIRIRAAPHLGQVLSTEQRADRAFVGPIERALGHGAPLVEVSWRRDVPGEEAVAWGVVALVMERWRGSAQVSPYGPRTQIDLPATPDAARAESRRLDPDLDWTPAPAAPPPSVRWASTGGVVFDEPVVVPRYAPPGEPPAPVFLAQMRVFPTKHVVFTGTELTKALDLSVTHTGLRPARADTPWIALLRRGDQGVLFVQPPFPSTVDELDHATFDEGTRGRVVDLLTSASPLGFGPSVIELQVDLVDPVDVEIARRVAIYLAERTEGVVAADHPMLLPRAGWAYTARALRELDAHAD